jgi:hypothetical protein
LVPFPFFFAEKGGGGGAIVWVWAGLGKGVHGGFGAVLPAKEIENASGYWDEIVAGKRGDGKRHGKLSLSAAGLVGIPIDGVSSNEGREG